MCRRSCSDKMVKDIGIGISHEQGQFKPLCRSVARLASEERNDMSAYGCKVRIAAFPEFVDIRSYKKIEGVGLFPFFIGMRLFV